MEQDPTRPTPTREMETKSNPPGQTLRLAFNEIVPPEILVELFMFLCHSTRDLTTLGLVCRRWKKVADSDLLWKPICQAYLSGPLKNYLSGISLYERRYAGISTLEKETQMPLQCFKSHIMTTAKKQQRWKRKIQLQHERDQHSSTTHSRTRIHVTIWFIIAALCFLFHSASMIGVSWLDLLADTPYSYLYMIGMNVAHIPLLAPFVSCLLLLLFMAIRYLISRQFFVVIGLCLIAGAVLLLGSTVGMSVLNIITSSGSMPGVGKHTIFVPWAIAFAPLLLELAVVQIVLLVVFIFDLSSRERPSGVSTWKLLLFHGKTAAVVVTHPAAALTFFVLLMVHLQFSMHFTFGLVVFLFFLLGMSGLFFVQVQSGSDVIRLATIAGNRRQAANDAKFRFHLFAFDIMLSSFVFLQLFGAGPDFKLFARLSFIPLLGAEIALILAAIVFSQSKDPFDTY